MVVSNTFVTQNVNTCPLSVLNLKPIRYDGFVLHPLQVFKNIQKYLFMQTDINMEMVLKIKNTGILGTVYEYDDAQS